MTNEEFIKSISHEGEEWRDVVGYEGLYIVSSLGRVYNIKTKRILNNIDYYGYNKVALYKDGEQRRHFIHRIVANAFIPNEYNLPQVDHIDTNRSNNNVSNLKWCSPKENCNNPITKNRQRLRMIGERNPLYGKNFSMNHRQKLSLSKKGKSFSTQERINRYHPKSIVQLSLNGQFIRVWGSVKDASATYNCNYRNILKAINGINKSSLNYKWMWESDYKNLVNKSKNIEPTNEAD